ncbi:MAG: diguanylate cyclase [Candidatus Omnitrophica bacterium]|nr:diguanylate cyclase [Candidatus Omnitrophota bacterium]
MPGQSNFDNKTEEQLNEEIKSLQSRLTELEKTESKFKCVEDELRKIELQQRAILNNIPDIAWLKDKESRFVAVNDSFSKSCGLSSEELAGKTDFDIWPRELAEKYRNDDKEVMDKKKRESFEEKLIDKQGNVKWIETVKTPIYNSNGDVIGTTGIARDISQRKLIEDRLREARSELEIRVKVRTAELTKTNEDLLKEVKERKKIEVSLRNSEQQYRTTIDSISDAIHVVDKDLKIVLFNSSFVDWNKNLGLDVEMAGKSIFEVFPFLPEKVKNEYSKVFKTGESLLSEEVTKFSNREIVTETRKIPIFIEGEVRQVLTIIRDITYRKLADKKLAELNEELLNSNVKLKELSLFDSYTGLYNHRYLENAIEAEFFRARRYAHGLAVIMLDIDYFKSINDVYGHQFGDLVLKQFAKQLKNMVRRYDIVVRYGGEEFVIVSPGIDRPQALNLAQRLLDALNLYNFGDKEHTVKLKLSLSVSSYPEDKAIKGVDLINLADHILNKVKEFGGNRVYSSLDLKKEKQNKVSKAKETPVVKVLKGRIDKLTKKANQSLVESIFAFAKTIELKDRYTGEHVENTVQYATDIARALALPKEEIELVKQAAMLHDLGKIGISEKILLKESKLSKKEFEEIKKHPQIGADIIRPIQFLHGLIPFIFYHHERWDGKGYPSGIKGEEIPMGARIIAIADVFQALISDRPYRKAFSKKDAIKIIEEGAGSQFDPSIVSIFLKILQAKKPNKRRGKRG